MAKTGFWLRGAKGKLAGTVLAKGERGTVQRELVKPTNPQTTKQMLQRVAFATAAVASKHMVSVIGQTFEGKGSRKKNRRAFIKLNTAKLKQDYIAFNGLFGQQQISPDTSSAIAKNVSVLVPNSYIISKGTLSSPAWLKPLVNAGRTEYIEGELELIDSMSFDNLTPLNVLDILNAMGINIGDQITFTAIATRNGEDNHAYEGKNNDYIRYASFLASRIVFSSDEDLYADNAIEVEVGETSASMKSKIQAAVKACIDEQTTDSYLYEQFAAVLTRFIAANFAEDGQGGIRCTLSIYQPNFWYNLANMFTIENQRIVAKGAIISNNEKGFWRYSNSEMVALAAGPISNDNTYHGLRYANAVDTFKGDIQSNSELFTQQGGAANSFIG